MWHFICIMESPNTCRSPNRVFLYFFFAVYGYFSAISPANGVLTHTVIQSDDVILTCDNSTNLKRTWHFNDNIVNNYRVIWDKLFKENSFITETYSLYIWNVSIEQEGIYQCKTGSYVLSNHSVKVEGNVADISFPNGKLIL